MEAEGAILMPADSTISVEFDEQVVQIVVGMGRTKQCTCYAIYDADLGYWRGTSALREYDAWTRDTSRRAVFQSRERAERELAAIHQWRLDHRRDEIEAAVADADRHDAALGEPIAA